MIENFTQAEFEAALPRDKSGQALWEHAGICERSNQHLYTVTPYAGLPFAILVWSSLQVDGASSKGAGEDSIRAIITYDGKPYGGKAKRWIPRTTNWRTMLTDMLRTLSYQISWLRNGCGSCGGVLMPFTSNKGRAENKGRTFVCCKNVGCQSPDWKWCEDADGKPLLAPKPAAKVQPAQTQSSLPNVPGFNVDAKALEGTIKAALALLEIGKVKEAHAALVKVMKHPLRL